MGSEINYKQITRKIDKAREFSDDEKTIIKAAVDELFTRYAIGANGIVSMIKITADERSFETFKGIVARARERVKSGKAALTPAERTALRECLSHLKNESVEKISNSIEGGNYLFLSLLYTELEKVDLKEMQKLQKIIDSMRQY